ncbi:MAG: radical SAM protein, partial [Myxococcota bacterium]|nr:radical SAM protein [Myxococcota bacterium]
TQQNHQQAHPSNTYRVVLVDFYWTRDKDPRIPLGHASLRASLARDPEIQTVPVVVAVNAGTHSASEITETILRAAEGIDLARVTIAFGAYVWGEALLKEVLGLIRARGFEGRVVLGGPQISYAGAGLERIYPEASAFVRGYGENALLALAKVAGKPHIPGVHWAGDSDPCAQANIDLETIPSPWLDGVIPLEGQRFIRWETQRGCQYRCAFCQHREAGARLQRRQLDLARIQKEIDLFCASGVEDIAVLDPILNSSEHAVAILERFAERGYKGRLSLQCRAEQITQEFVDAAAMLDTRLEFGLQTIHRNEGAAVKRPNHLPGVEEALRMVREAGIAHEV